MGDPSLSLAAYNAGKARKHQEDIAAEASAALETATKRAEVARRELVAATAELERARAAAVDGWKRLDDARAKADSALAAAEARDRADAIARADKALAQEAGGAR